MNAGQEVAARRAECRWTSNPPTDQRARRRAPTTTRHVGPVVIAYPDAMTGRADQWDPAVVAGWVFDTNVHALVESLAALVSYEVDDLDWDAIDSALPATDAEDQSGWYTYPLVGVATLTIELANEPDAAVTSVRIHHPGDAMLGAQIETVVAVLSRYRVAD